MYMYIQYIHLYVVDTVYMYMSYISKLFLIHCLPLIPICQVPIHWAPTLIVVIPLSVYVDSSPVSVVS